MGKIGKFPAPGNTATLQGTQLSKQLPVLFRTQKPEASDGLVDEAPPPSSLHQASTADQTPASESPNHDLPALLRQLPTRDEMSSFSTDIKQTLLSAVTELRQDLREVGQRLAILEGADAGKTTELRALRLHQDATTRSLIDMRRHVEDLDNRGRRANIRVRGIPESIPPDSIQLALARIFNELLDRPPDTPIEFVRAHRALRPRSMLEAQPRDVVCCLLHFPLKEEILRQARLKGTYHFEGSEVKLFQDLSNVTLQQRKALQPLLEHLRRLGIKYRWRFPFGLSATHGGRSALLRLPEDVEDFCAQLDVPYIGVQDWYGDLRMPASTPAEKHQASSSSSTASSPARDRSPIALKQARTTRSRSDARPSQTQLSSSSRND